MNKTLIIPVAGQSSRFPDMRPKWLLTHPNGNFMFAEAISGFDFNNIEKVYLVCLKEHLDKYKCYDGIMKQFDKVVKKDIFDIIILEEKTRHQPETVFKAIEQKKIVGSFCIKDCDNFFNINANGDNFVSISSLNNSNLINPSNKSYVNINENNIINNIVEKDVISKYFCTGCYGFKDTNDYIKFYNELKDKENLYISHIIYKMILENFEFRAIECENYIDWGTIEEWQNYTSQYVTIFIDLDGTLVNTSSEYFEPKWGETKAIRKNADIINKLYDSGKVHVIITTSRSSSSKDITLKQLQQENIKFHDIIFDLYHGKRLLINDYSKTNPYRSCDVINIKRDSEDLENMLKGLI